MHFLSKLKSDKRLDLAEAHVAVRHLRDQILNRSADPAHPGSPLVGQETLVDRVLIALLVGEHVLLEGNPGLAKTLTSQTMGQMAGLAYKRVQFMPDMMPSDLILKEFLSLEGGQTKIVSKRGPLFTNVLLADEINRASPKAQAALLEACGEGHATLMHRGREVIRPHEPYDEAALLADHGPFYGLGAKLDPRSRRGQVFMVIATQNPIEQEGVYPLSRAQEDRFLFKLTLEYPPGEALTRISEHAFDVHEPPKIEISPADHVRALYFFTALKSSILGAEASAHWLAEANAPLRERVEGLINFSHYRPPGQEDDGAAAGLSRKQAELEVLLKRWDDSGQPRRARELRRLATATTRGQALYPDVVSGASPRGLIGLIRAAHAHAFLHGRVADGLVKPTWDDFRALAPDVLRHRVRLTPGCEAMGARSDSVVDALLRWIDAW